LINRMQGMALKRKVLSRNNEIDILSSNKSQGQSVSSHPS